MAQRTRIGSSVNPDDYEPPEFFDETTPRARKRYRCCECQTHIPIGDRYTKSTGKWDGSVSSFKSCMPCGRLRTWAWGHNIQTVFGELAAGIKYSGIEVPAMLVIAMQAE